MNNFKTLKIWILGLGILVGIGPVSGFAGTSSGVQIVSTELIHLQQPRGLQGVCFYTSPLPENLQEIIPFRSFSFISYLNYIQCSIDLKLSLQEQVILEFPAPYQKRLFKAVISEVSINPFLNI